MKHKYWLETVLLCGVMQSAPAQSILKNKDEKLKNWSDSRKKL